MEYSTLRSIIFESKVQMIRFQKSKVLGREQVSKFPEPFLSVPGIGINLLRNAILDYLVD